MSRTRFKILLAVHCFFPLHIHGTERYTLELAKSLQHLGNDVFVLTAGEEPEDSTGESWNEYMFEGVRVLTVDPGATFRSSYERPELADVFRRILCKEKPDLVHCCHLLNLGGSLIGVAKEANLPVVCSLTDFFGLCFTCQLMTLGGRPCNGPRRNSANCVADFYNAVLADMNGKLGTLGRRLGRIVPGSLWCLLDDCAKFLLGRELVTFRKDLQLRKNRLFEYYRQVDVFLAATEFMKDVYVSHGFPEDRFRKITFGIMQPDEKEVIALKKRYTELQHGAPMVFGFIGQIAYHKGVDLLVKAFQEAKLPKAELHLYGDLDQHPSYAKSVLAASKADPRIKFPGTFPGMEIYQKLSRMHVLCIPSRWGENAPLVLLNGLASKTFLVVSQGRGLVEFVRDGVNGVICESASVKSLASSLKNLSEERDRLLEKTGMLPGYGFTPDDYAQQVDRMYRHLIKDHPNPSFVEVAYDPPPKLVLREASPPSSGPKPYHEVKTLPHDQLINMFQTHPFSFAVTSRICPGQGSVVLSDVPGFSEASEVIVNLAFEEDGLTVFYYTLDPRDDFGEEFKLTWPVKAHTEYELRLCLFKGDKHMSALRWDLIYSEKDCQITIHDFQIKQKID
jgi:glycosyltransferase involved in cell wall biosynthesis